MQLDKKKERSISNNMTHLSVIFSRTFIHMSGSCFPSEDMIVNIIANSMTRYYKCSRSANARSVDYSNDTRLVSAHKQISAPFNSASPADYTEPNFAGEHTSSRAHIHAYNDACSLFGRKGFYRYEFNFRTNSPGLSLSLSFSLSLYLFQQHSTNRALCANADVVCRVLREEQGWRALQHTTPYPGWLSVIQ